MKISHKDLESCRISPKAWVAAKQDAGGRASFSYRQALNLSISTFHVTNDLDEAKARAEGYVAKNFKDEKKIAYLYEALDDYAAWFMKSGIVTVDTNVRLSFPFKADWQLGGLVSRVDLLTSGYRAILFETIVSNWKGQLRMPLIQTAIAEHYGRPATEVRVGLQNLEGNEMIDTRFGSKSRISAALEFKALGIQVQKLLPPPPD